MVAARVVLIAFVVGGLFYFTQAFPVTVDVTLRVPYKVVSTDGDKGLRRRDVREISITFENEAAEKVAQSQLYFDAGVGPEGTKPARLSLVPGSYKVLIVLNGRQGGSLQLTRETMIEEEGELTLDLR